MLASDFTDVLDLRERVSDKVIQIRTAGFRVAVSQRLMDALLASEHIRRRGEQLLINGYDRGGLPFRVTYLVAGFDPTSDLEVNEGGFHLLTRSEVQSGEDEPGETSMPDDPADLAQIAYQAYGEVTDFKNFRGEPMPAWGELGDLIRSAWIRASQAVADQCCKGGDRA